MKKALIVLLILGVAGGLFAQSVSWTGSVGTGLFIGFGENFDDVPVWAHDDDDGAGVIAKINGAYDADVWGLKLGTVGRAGDGFDLSFYNAYGWMKLLNKIITVRAGMIDDGAWSTGLEYDTGIAGGGGIRIEVEPITGLNFGAFFTFPNGGLSAGKIGNFFQETVIGAEYKSSLFRVDVAMALFSEESEYSNFDNMDMRVIFGFEFTGVPGLTLGVSGGVDHLAEYADEGVFKIYEEGHYKLGALKVGLVLGQKMTGPDGFVWFLAKPKLEFAINSSFSVGLDVPLEFDTSDGFEFALFGANLWAKYTLGGSWFKLGYGLRNVFDGYGGIYDIAGRDLTNDGLAHYLKFIFGFSF